MTFKKRVLSIDGGGIRGIIPAMLLEYIENKTEKRIAEMFDLIAGTSTGGILALGLTKKDSEGKPLFTASKLKDIYIKDGSTIFQERFPGRFDELFESKFGSENRKKVLLKYFGDTLLSENLKEVLITSYDIEERTPLFFTNNPNATIKQERVFEKICGRYTLQQAAMATSAAPTFFPPYQIEKENEQGNYALVDGGVFANNPTSLAMMEMMISHKRDTGEDLSRHDILIVSLGTGSLTRPYRYEQAKNWGQLKWALPVLDIFSDSQSEAVACQLQQLLSPEQYYRFQCLLDLAKDNMDDASTDNINDLIKQAEELIRNNQNRLNNLCDLLKV